MRRGTRSPAPTPTLICREGRAFSLDTRVVLCLHSTECGLGRCALHLFRTLRSTAYSEGGYCFARGAAVGVGVQGVGICVCVCVHVCKGGHLIAALRSG